MSFDTKRLTPDTLERLKREHSVIRARNHASLIRRLEIKRDKCRDDENYWAFWDEMLRDARNSESHNHVVEILFATAKTTGAKDYGHSGKMGTCLSSPDEVFAYQGNNLTGDKLWPEWWSLSVGDVVIIDGERWLCLASDWRKLTDAEMRRWKSTPQRDRRWLTASELYS